MVATKSPLLSGPPPVDRLNVHFIVTSPGLFHGDTCKQAGNLESQTVLFVRCRQRRKNIVKDNLETTGLVTCNLLSYLCCAARYFGLDGDGFAKCGHSHVDPLKHNRSHCFPYVLHI